MLKSLPGCALGMFGIGIGIAFSIYLECFLNNLYFFKFILFIERNEMIINDFSTDLFAFFFSWNGVNTMNY